MHKHRKPSFRQGAMPEARSFREDLSTRKSTGTGPGLSRILATLSQHRLIHGVGSYRAWNATANLKVLQRGGKEPPLMGLLGFSVKETARPCAVLFHRPRLRYIVTP